MVQQIVTVPIYGQEALALINHNYLYSCKVQFVDNLVNNKAIILLILLNVVSVYSTRPTTSSVGCVHVIIPRDFAGKFRIESNTRTDQIRGFLIEHRRVSINRYHGGTKLHCC